MILETTFLIDVLRGKPEVKSLMNELQRKEPLLFVATPSVMELWSGALQAQQTEQEKEKIQELIRSLNILPLDEKSAREAGEIEVFLIRKGIGIQTEDTMIAGIARAYSEMVITRDEHYSRIPGLRVLKY